MKLAFIGFRHPHIYTLYKHAQERSDIDIVAACEEDEATYASLVEHPQIDLTHTSLDGLLDAVECDAVAIGDYFAKRGELILKLLEADKHVIVDKPVCTSLSELAAIQEKVAGGQRKLGCMLDMRDSPQAIGLRNMIRQGLIGDVHAITFGGQHPLMLDTRATWYFELGKHGGTINDIAIHAIDVLPWITGLQFAEIQAARTWNAFAPEYPHFHDAAQMMFSLDNGCGVLGDVSYFMPNSMGYTLYLYWRMTFWGRKGVLETATTIDHIMVALDGETEPRREPLPAGNPGGYLQTFMDDISGQSEKNDALNTEAVLASTRIALMIQEVADQNREEG